MSRTALLVTHTGRARSTAHARTVAQDLRLAGFEVRVLAEEEAPLDLAGLTAVSGAEAAAEAEIVLALGGDGTLLRAAELARPAGVPLLGINLGKVGFLAEAELADLEKVVAVVADRSYTVEERLTLDVTAELDRAPVASSWALNEVSVEKSTRAMLELLVDVDGRPLSRYGCDGVVCATPTGSTAYAFSAGGPVVWPELSAMLLVPVSAHTLFSRPLVVAPTSTIAVTVEPYAAGAVLCCDGRRTFPLPPGARVTVCRGAAPVRVVRLPPHRPFTDRLVAKFGLPVHGWRHNHEHAEWSLDVDQERA